MLSLGVVKFFFYLALPYLLTRGIGWLTGSGKARKNNNGKKEGGFLQPLSPKETFVYSVAIIAILNYALATYGPVQKPSFFQMIHCPTNAPTFLVREHYQAYCDRRAEESDAFREAREAYEAAGSPSLGGNPADDGAKEPDGGTYKRHRYAAREPFFLPYLRWAAALFSGPLQNYQSSGDAFVSEEQLEFEHVTYLFERLKMPSRRTLYLKYGEEPFLDGGSFCRDDNDYILFLAPATFMTYLQFLLVLGLLTTLPKKANWRAALTLFAVVLLVCEVLFFVAPQEMEGSLALFDVLFPFKDMQDETTVPQKLELTRRALFGAALLLALLLDNGSKVSDVDLLLHIHQKMDATAARDHTLKMMRQAVLGNAVLRDFYMKHIVDPDSSHASTSLYKNADFIKATEKIVDQYDLEKMAQMTQEDLHAVLATIPFYEKMQSDKVAAAAATTAEDSSNKNHQD